MKRELAIPREETLAAIAPPGETPLWGAGIGRAEPLLPGASESCVNLGRYGVGQAGRVLALRALLRRFASGKEKRQEILLTRQRVSITNITLTERLVGPFFVYRIQGVRKVLV